MIQTMGRRDEEFNGGFNSPDTQQPMQGQPVEQPQMDLPGQMMKMSALMIEIAAQLKQMAEAMAQGQ